MAEDAVLNSRVPFLYGLSADEKVLNLLAKLPRFPETRLRFRCRAALGHGLSYPHLIPIVG